MRNIVSYLVLIIVLTSCQSHEIQVVESIHKDGSPKIVMDYLISGSDSIPLHEVNFHEDGSKMMEGEYVDGLREGEWISWFPDGSVWSKGYFTKGKRSGKSWIYHPNGQMYMKGAYRDGAKTGMWIVFDENGIVETQKEF